MMGGVVQHVITEDVHWWVPVLVATITVVGGALIAWLKLRK